MFQRKIDNDLALELVNEHRAEAVFNIINRQQDYLSQWMAWPPHTKQLDDYKAFIKTALHAYAEGKSLTCFILYQDTVVGSIGFNYINQSLRKVEIGYWLSQDQQGKGIMSRAVSCLIEIAFNELNVDKVEIPISEGNMPSRGVCERLGFVNEGTIKNAENLNGRIMDHVYYGLMRR